MSPSGRRRSVVARGRRAYDRVCGTEVHLRDVMPGGDVVIDRLTTPCGGPEDRTYSVVMRVPARGPTLALYRQEIGETPHVPVDRRLRGGRLFDVADNAAQVIDLSTGRIRAFPGDSPTAVVDADIDPAGRVVLSELRVDPRGRPLGWRFRLVGPSDASTGGRILSRPRGTFLQPRFCGDRLVEYRLRWRPGSRGRLDIEGGRRMRGGRPGNFRYYRSVCDSRTYVGVFDHGERKRTRMRVFPLPPRP